ncbi:class I SAM-dependent methyltransferase [Streptomyces sp. NPDC046977]|uniref:class I SAM-dependent methyltransferase n=1 Tax=Streptomyces sp. NPDC046977 TaxID=3154703 RepID=UPI0033CDBB6E
MTEHAYLAAVRESYDTVAEDYALLVSAPSELDPMSRSALTAFAELVRASGRGLVADVGCGPGKVTAHLAGLGLTPVGIDVSPKMIELARKAHPDLRFSVGSMTALDIEDGTLDGILAYYSTHHTPLELLPVVFSEFHRSLAPGGHLLVVGHVGAGEHRRPTQAYGGHPVSYASYRRPADQLVELMRQAGLTLTAQLMQEPDEELTWRIGSFFARKPAAADGSRP